MAAAGSGEPSMLVVARDLFKGRGPICDSEGFYQHTGECWNDALQMIFLFSDGFKEFVQPFILNMNIDESDLTGFTRQYLTMTQKRFVRHYMAELEKRASKNKNLLAISKKNVYRTRGKEGIAAAAAGKQEEICAYKPGGEIKDVNFVISLFQPIFAPGEIEKLIFAYSFQSKVYNAVAPTIGTGNAFITLPALIAGSMKPQGIYFTFKFKEADPNGHALCFYTCGGVDYFYEDTYGPVVFPWRFFLQQLEENSMLHPSGILRKKKRDTSQTVYMTTMYPVMEKRIGSTIKYYTCFEGIPEIVEIKPDVEFETSTTEYDFRIKYMSFPIVTIQILTTLHLKGIDIPSSDSNVLIPGSRIYNLNAALKVKNAYLFEQSFSPEKLEGLKISPVIFDRKSENGDRILARVYPHRNRLKDSEDVMSDLYLARFAVENDYPRLLQAIFDKDPSFRDKNLRRGRMPIIIALEQNNSNVIPVICQKPLPKEVFEKAVEIIDDYKANSSAPDVVAAFEATCRQAAEGGGRYKRTRRQRRAKRKTAKHRKI